MQETLSLVLMKSKLVMKFLYIITNVIYFPENRKRKEGWFSSIQGCAYSAWLWLWKQRNAHASNGYNITRQQYSLYAKIPRSGKRWWIPSKYIIFFCILWNQWLKEK